LFHFGRSIGLALRTATIATEEIQRDGANRCIKQRAVANAVIASPKTNECFLNNIFGVGWRTNPLPGKKEQTRRELGEANSPLFIGSDILHDLFTVFYN
jgi:hypothetical protein